jgi:hypothetical protein
MKGPGCHLRWLTPAAAAHELQASATRAVCNGGIRLGLYDPIKGLMSQDGTGRDLHVGQKLAAGSISGGIGAVLTTPIELAKTRLQVRCVQCIYVENEFFGQLWQQQSRFYGSCREVGCWAACDLHVGQHLSGAASVAALVQC